jgi:hypothetical protein
MVILISEAVNFASRRNELPPKSIEEPEGLQKSFALFVMSIHWSASLICSTELFRFIDSVWKTTTIEDEGKGEISDSCTSHVDFGT